MEMTENVELTKEKNLTGLIDLLRKNNMQEAANNIFEMAAYVDVMENKMNTVLEELTAVKDQLHKMEEREAEKGLKQTLKRAVNKLEQDCQAMKEKLLEVKAEIKAKAGEIVTSAKQKGKAALNRVSEFLGVKKKLQNIRQNVQESIEDVDKSIGKIDAFGKGMREAGQKIANTFRTFADKPEKEYGEKKFSKTELIKKPFQAKRKLLSGILNCADAAIEKAERLASDVKQQWADKREHGSECIEEKEQISSASYAKVAETKFQYGAEIFETQQEEIAKALSESKQTKNAPMMNARIR